MTVCNSKFDPAAPLTVKVREHVLGQIRRGIWPAGQHLPSVRELAERLDVSTNVVFLAVKELRDERIVEKRANGRHVISDQAAGVVGGSKALRLGFCSRGTDHIRQPIYQSIFNHLDRLCRARGDSLELLIELHDTWVNLDENHYDALIVADWQPDHYRRMCRGPCIGLDTWEGVVVDLAVKTDHHKGGELAGRHLRGLGRKRVVYWDVIREKAHLLQGMALRRLGFLKGWVEAGGDLDDVVHLPVLATEGNQLEQVAGQIGKADAFFVYSDGPALSIWECLNALGVSVPGDIALMGFDGSYDALTHEPPLTTVRQPCQQIAETIMTQLTQAVFVPLIAKGGVPRELLIEPTLVPGQST